MTLPNRFDRRVNNIPDGWSSPLVEVVDTADTIRLALEDWEIDSPELILGLTKLVLDRHDKEAMRPQENN